jgi:hypothetical protein
MWNDFAAQMRADGHTDVEIAEATLRKAAEDRSDDVREILQHALDTEHVIRATNRYTGFVFTGRVIALYEGAGRRIASAVLYDEVNEPRTWPCEAFKDLTLA